MHNFQQQLFHLQGIGFCRFQRDQKPITNRDYVLGGCRCIKNRLKLGFSGIFEPVHQSQNRHKRVIGQSERTDDRKALQVLAVIDAIPIPAALCLDQTIELPVAQCIDGEAQSQCRLLSGKSDRATDMIAGKQ